GHAVQVARHDRRGHADELRERAPRAVRVRRAAEVLAPAAAVAADAAGSGDARDDALAGAPRRHPAADRDDLAGQLVAHRERERDARVAALEDLQVRAARDGAPHAHDDLSRSRRGRRDLPLLEAADLGLDEGEHGRALTYHFLRFPPGVAFGAPGLASDA